MEATGKIRASKSKKKGGKGTQVISAADEARKREAIKEALRQKLELERKALQVVERLLEDSVTEEFLIDCAWHITPANYKDTVEERGIAKLCGYPRCPNKLTKIPTQQFKISTKTNRVYDITERKCFCSNFCYKASKCFELQISKTPLWLRKEERGSSGQEINLVDKPLTEADIENPDSGKDPPLPLVDSHAQHLIQKRIAVEKLSQSLRDVVGPLHLMMSDVINDINNLVRTFRFSNTNIIHKRPEWTLIAVVLLSVLTEVSPLLRESLASPSSLEYISSLMSELKLEDKDLHNLVLLFKPCVTPQT
uniref:RNA polymerase II subunit B1 CTD phosphatase RPAP2 homolog n=1 Tax=Cyprinus carpio carpio TaxID=630221 RepID=A0A8C1BRX7_CYPCA